MKIVFLLAMSIVTFVLYQNCSDSIENIKGQSVAGKSQQKTLKGVVDLSKPVNLRPPKLYQAVESGLEIDLNSGEIVADPTGNWQGLCLSQGMASDLYSLLEGAQVCRDISSSSSSKEDVVCTMEYNYPYAELFLSIESGKISLGKGNDCPREPTQLCKNNEAFVALIDSIKDQDIQSCQN